MPTLSVFYGIVVTMYFDDHGPPHIHVRYGGEKAVVAIADGGILKGHLAPRAARLISEWVALRRAELERNWELAHTGLDLVAVEPLP